MHKVPTQFPVPDVSGFLFHLSSLGHGLPDGPRGIFVDRELAAKYPTIRQRDVNGTKYFAAVKDSYFGVSDGSPMSHLLKFKGLRSPDGSSVCRNESIEIYADVPRDERSAKTIKRAIETGDDSPELVEIVETLLREGVAFARELSNILRRTFDQYWYIDAAESALSWSGVQFHDTESGMNYAIRAPEGLVETLIKPQFTTGCQGPIVLRSICEADVEAIARAVPAPDPTFADEMISTSLVDLSHGRTRSAIIHCFIAYESVAKHALDVIMSHGLAGLPAVPIVEAIARDLSTATLGMYVFSILLPGAVINWGKIENLYNVRNMIVHKRRKRMPSFKEIEEAILEVRSFVVQTEDILREIKEAGSGQPSISFAGGPGS